MADGGAEYRQIVEICRESQELWNRRVKEVGVYQAWIENLPYSARWSSYHPSTPVVVRNADFSGLFFHMAQFERHTFVDCDFSNSRWDFARIVDSTCTGSRFSGMSAFALSLKNTDCSKCDFAGASILPFDPFEGTRFLDANFSRATLATLDSYLKHKDISSRATFSNAKMDGCKMIFAKESGHFKMTKREIRSLLQQIFDRDQLAVMHIDYGGRECFVATAACGVDSESVARLRDFRDSVLMHNAPGRLFVRSYYRVSPPIALFLESAPGARWAARNLLVRPIVRLLGQSYATTSFLIAARPMK